MDEYDDIDRAIDYCDTLDPGFAKRIQGAPAALIDEVAEWLRAPLAAPHRRFLERMGASTGGLDLGAFDTSAQALADGLAETYGTPVAGFALFAVATGEPEEDLYLVERDGARVLEKLNSRIGVTHDSLAGDVGVVMAASIAEFLGRSMLQQQVIAGLPYRSSYVLRPQADPDAPEPAMFDALDAITASFGLAPLWFSSSVARDYAGEGVVVGAKQGERVSFVVTVTGIEHGFVNRFGEALMRELNLEEVH